MIAMLCIHRRDTDSSVFAIPRTLTRVFCEQTNLAGTVRFYEVTTGQQLDQDIDLSENCMRIIAIGGFLLLVLDPDKVDPIRYQDARNTIATIVVNPFVAKLNGEVIGDAIYRAAARLEPFARTHSRVRAKNRSGGHPVQRRLHRYRMAQTAWPACPATI
jgi:hypothetical protein